MSGKMTEDSLKELVNQVFLLIDVNQNGVLEEDEVRNFFKQMIAKHQPGRAFSEALFKVNWYRMDKNSDDKVTMEELWHFMKDKAQHQGTI